MLVFAQDFGWAGTTLLLALVFNPFPNTSFSELALSQNVLILGQMGIAILFVVVSLFQAIQN